MTVSLEGLARNAALATGRCVTQAGLEELQKNVRSVIDGEEPMSEFARFYSFVPNVELSSKLLLEVGFEYKEESDCHVLYDAETDYYLCKHCDDGVLDWTYVDSEGDAVMIKTPKNFAELWILCEALGFTIKNSESSK